MLQSSGMVIFQGLTSLLDRPGNREYATYTVGAAALYQLGAGLSERRGICPSVL
jgi:hypothetical protein